MLKHYDETFELLIEKEFSFELMVISKLKGVELPAGQKELLEFFKNKYKNGCPSQFYSHISNRLKSQYDDLHNAISKLLYN